MPELTGPIWKRSDGSTTTLSHWEGQEITWHIRVDGHRLQSMLTPPSYHETAEAATSWIDSRPDLFGVRQAADGYLGAT